MAINIQSLSFKSSKDRVYHPVLRQGSGLKSLLLHYTDSSPSKSAGEKDHNNSSAVSYFSSYPYFHGRRLMRWRAFQFRDPDDTYVYRARIEPRPPNEPVTEHKQHNAAVSILIGMLAHVCIHVLSITSYYCTLY